MALYPEWQERVAAEAHEIGLEDFSSVARLKIARDVFRETLRLYPPVPMMVREASCPETFRERAVPTGAQIVISRGICTAMNGSGITRTHSSPSAGRARRAGGLRARLGSRFPPDRGFAQVRVLP